MTYGWGSRSREGEETPGSLSGGPGGGFPRLARPGTGLRPAPSEAAVEVSSGVGRPRAREGASAGWEPSERAS